MLLAAVVITVRSMSAEPAEIIFLHLKLDAKSITLLDITNRPGLLKSARFDQKSGPLAYEMRTATGGILKVGHLADPLVQRLEYAVPDGKGTLKAFVVQRESAEFTLRLPGYGEARAVHFFRASDNPLQKSSERQLLGVIQLPEKKNP